MPTCGKNVRENKCYSMKNFDGGMWVFILLLIHSDSKWNYRDDAELSAAVEIWGPSEAESVFGCAALSVAAAGSVADVLVVAEGSDGDVSVFEAEEEKMEVEDNVSVLEPDAEEELTALALAFSPATLRARV